jgi:nicotinamidase-related amidase
MRPAPGNWPSEAKRFFKETRSMRNLDHFVPPRDATAIVLVDFQERLFEAMEPHRKELVLQNTKLLLQLAKAMELPVLVTEQYPKGLGKTLPQVLADLPPGVEAAEKLVFSSWRAEGVAERFHFTGAKCGIVIGMESHVCVLGTVLDMLSEDIVVHVPRDAVISRTRENCDTGLQLMDRAGAWISSTETIIFQMLDRAGTDEFKFMSKLLK